MFTFMKSSQPDAVAKCAYKAMMKGKTIVYHSPQTKLVNIGTRIASRRFTAKIAKKINGILKGGK